MASHVAPSRADESGTRGGRDGSWLRYSQRRNDTPCPACYPCQRHSRSWLTLPLPTARRHLDLDLPGCHRSSRLTIPARVKNRSHRSDVSCRPCCTTRLVHGRSASAVRCGHGRPKEPRDRIHSHHRLRTADKTALGEAVGHIAKYWDGLCAPLTGGRIEIGNGTAERTIRSIALNRKNAHFAGHDARVKNWPTIVSLINQRQDSFKGIKGLGGLGSDRQTRLSNIPAEDGV